MHEAEQMLGAGLADEVMHSRPVSFEHTSREWWERGFRHVFTDGARTHPQDNIIGRAAYALFYEVTHPWNISRPLLGYDQSAYRAELRACLEAVETSYSEIPHGSLLTTSLLLVQPT